MLMLPTPAPPPPPPAPAPPGTSEGYGRNERLPDMRLLRDNARRDVDVLGFGGWGRGHQHAKPLQGLGGDDARVVDDALRGGIGRAPRGREEHGAEQRSELLGGSRASHHGAPVLPCNLRMTSSSADSTASLSDDKSDTTPPTRTAYQNRAPTIGQGDAAPSYVRTVDQKPMCQPTHCEQERNDASLRTRAKRLLLVTISVRPMRPTRCTSSIISWSTY